MAPVSVTLHGKRWFSPRYLDCFCRIGAHARGLLYDGVNKINERNEKNEPNGIDESDEMDRIDYIDEINEIN